MQQSPGLSEPDPASLNPTPTGNAERFPNRRRRAHGATPRTGGVNHSEALPTVQGSATAIAEAIAEPPQAGPKGEAQG